MLTRRAFNLGATSAAFGGLALAGCSGITDKLSRVPKFGNRLMRRAYGYGDLVPDRAKRPLLDLPACFEYQKISCQGDPMASGGCVPGNADGMGSFCTGEANMVLLVRNHELSDGGGGTTTIEYDCDTRVVKRQYRSLEGTRKNCSGGVTPWGTWLSCEEEVKAGVNHGFVYEVPALSDDRPRREPLKHLGRFNHEAAVVDSLTNIIYMTEDQVDGLFYRYVPPTCDRPLDPGGALQALAFADSRYVNDSSNWGRDQWPIGETREVRWITLEPSAQYHDDLRERGRKAGAVRFAAGEGLYFGQGELFFCVTSGGRIKSGQIMRYVPGEGDHGQLQLFLESTDPRTINYADNLVVAPNGHLIVCEDPYVGGERNFGLRGYSVGPEAPCYLRGITPEGEVYDIARLHGGSELAGACFSPKGDILFVNVYSPATTLAIRGPWQAARQDWSLCPAGEARAPGALANRPCVKAGSGFSAVPDACPK